MRVTKISYRAAIGFAQYETKTLEMEVTLNEDEAVNSEAACKVLRDLVHGELVKAQGEAEKVKGTYAGVPAPEAPKTPSKRASKPRASKPKPAPKAAPEEQKEASKAPIEASDSGPQLQEHVPEEKLTPSSGADDPKKLADAKTFFIKAYQKAATTLGNEERVQLLKTATGKDNFGEILKTSTIAELEEASAGFPKIIKRMGK